MLALPPAPEIDRLERTPCSHGRRQPASVPMTQRVLASQAENLAGPAMSPRRRDRQNAGAGLDPECEPRPVLARPNPEEWPAERGASATPPTIPPTRRVQDGGRDSDRHR